VVRPERNQAQAARLFTGLLGRPGEQGGDVVVWEDVDPGALLGA
jgi:hypothetical protein